MTALDDAAARVALRAEVSARDSDGHPTKAICPVCGLEYAVVGKGRLMVNHGPRFPGRSCSGSGALIRDNA